MSQFVKIPTSMNPFVAIINGLRYEYPAGEIVEVPDNVAEVIRGYEKGNFPKPATKATEISMVSPSGKSFALSVGDDGKLVVSPVEDNGEVEIITFSIADDDTTYSAEKGMTWRQWVESEYNPPVTCERCGEEIPNIAITDGNVNRVEHNTDSEGICNGGLYPVVSVLIVASEEEYDRFIKGEEVEYRYPDLDEEIDPNLFYGWDG